MILAAGALQSPQLLLLSGVGDGEALRGIGIPTVTHLPGVGRNLRDHIDFVIAYESPRKDLIGFMPGDIVNALRSAIRYHRERRGIFTSNIAEAGGFVKTSPELAAPDIQLHFCIGILESHGRRLHAARGFSSHVCALRPKSAGELTLASRDPLAAPRIDPGFYTHPDDLETMVSGFRITRAISESPLLDPFRGKELFTADARSDDEIRARAAPAFGHDLPPGRDLPDGRGRHGRRRSQPARARRVVAARRGRVGHADADRRQHQRADHHDRRAGERPHSGRGLTEVGAPMRGAH